MMGDAPREPGCVVSCFETYIEGSKSPHKLYHRILSNRWCRTTAYAVVTISCCAIYFGWQQFQKILFQGGAYAWLCTEPGWNYERDGACQEQNAQVQTLYTIATAMEFVVGVVAGMVLDHLGPRACGLTGLSVLCLGVILLMTASQTFQSYIPSMILLGGSVNLVAFPALLAGDFFPGHQAVAISFIVACQIGCALVAVILLEIWRAAPHLHMNDLFIGYLLCVWIPCCVLYFFFLPCRRRVQNVHCPLIGDEEELSIGRKAKEGGDSAMETERQITSSTVEPRTTPTVTSSDGEVAMVQLDRLTTLNSDSKRESDVKGEMPDREALTKLEVQTPRDRSFVEPILLKGDWRQFVQELLTWDVEIFALYYVLQLLQFVYYPTTTLQMFGTWMSDFAGYIMPMQIFWGIFFGWIVDRVGTIPLCFLMNTLNALTFSLMSISIHDLQYITVIANNISQSFIYTSKYTYVAEIYNPHNFGKLSGYIGFLGGVFAFLNIPIASSPNYTLWSIVFLGVSVFCFGVLAVLYWRGKKGINHIKGDPQPAIERGDSPQETMSLD